MTLRGLKCTLSKFVVLVYINFHVFLLNVFPVSMLTLWPVANACFLAESLYWHLSYVDNIQQCIQYSNNFIQIWGKMQQHSQLYLRIFAQVSMVKHLGEEKEWHSASWTHWWQKSRHQQAISSNWVGVKQEYLTEPSGSAQEGMGLRTKCKSQLTSWWNFEG